MTSRAPKRGGNATGLPPRPTRMARTTADSGKPSGGYGSLDHDLIAAVALGFQQLGIGALQKILG